MRKFSSYLQVPVFLPEYLNFFSKQPIKQFANKFPSFSNRKDHKILFNLIFVYWQKPSSNVRQIKIIQLHVSVSKPFPVGNYLLKLKNRNTKTRCEICSKLTIKIAEGRQWRCSGILIVNFEHISHLVLVFLLFTLNM